MSLTWLRMPLDLIAATSFLFAFRSVRGNEISALLPATERERKFVRLIGATHLLQQRHRSLPALAWPELLGEIHGQDHTGLEHQPQATDSPKRSLLDTPHLLSGT